MELNNDFLTTSALSLAERIDLPWDFLNHATVVVTGSTGLIGSQLVRVLLARNDLYNSDISLILPVRNRYKALAYFGCRPEIEYIDWDLNSPLALSKKCGYFIHAACDTSSKSFLNKPAETILSIINGAKNTLQTAANSSAKKYLFLSTMEVYGEVSEAVSEEDLGKLNTMIVRNSYPEAKRLAECLCAAYASEFSLETVVLRLAQTFGQGVSKNDGRVFAEFGRHAVAGKDIVLYSDGAKKNMYLSINDAITAIVFALAKAKSGNAYNVANEATYCSIKEMADLVLGEFGKKDAVVRREVDQEREASFRKSSDLALDCSKIKALGWEAQDSLTSMYDSMLKCW
ncbi:MAG: NAD(P)-dependent oxidoreductase [Streptococcus salivarius]|nr:NAD(P)-dependent oxidoreductase [Streptococcus salivarius]